MSTLYFLDIANARILSTSSLSTFNAEPTLVLDLSRNPAAPPAIRAVQPDGIAHCSKTDTLFFTLMGGDNDARNGSIHSLALGDSSRAVVIPADGTIMTPKQIVLGRKTDSLYFCDREGMKVLRVPVPSAASPAVGQPEVLVSTGEGDEDAKDRRRHCVGVAVDEEAGCVYWTQKGPPKGGEGRICRARIEAPADGKGSRKVEVLLENLPEPIDLELDLQGGRLYWTDRGDDKDDGNTFNSVALPLSDSPISSPLPRSSVKVLARGFQEAICLALDKPNSRAFVSDLSGKIYSVPLAGEAGQERTLLVDVGGAGKGEVTGLVLV